MVHQDQHGLVHEDHPDVEVSGLSDGQILQYQASSGKWKNASISSSSPDFPACKAYRSTALSLSNNTWTEISLNAEEFDTDSMHDNSVNPTRITVPSGKGGYYLIIGMVSFVANSTGNRAAAIRKNGSAGLETIYGTPSSGYTCAVKVATVVSLAAGDYIELRGWQNSGSSLSLSVGATNTYLILVKQR